MEYRDIAALFQLAFNLKAPGCRDVLQVYSTKRTGNQCNCVYKLIHVFGLYAQRKSIYIPKRLKQHTFPFHYRHSCLRTDISKTQHCCSVRDNRAQIVPAGQLVRFVNVLLDLKTGLGNSRCIGKG